MASTFTSVQFMDPPGGPGVTGAVKAGSGISISADGTISTQQGGGIVKTIVGTNGVVTTGTTDVIVSLNPPVGATIGGVKTVEGSGISIDGQGVIRSIQQYTILAGTGISISNVTPISSTVSVNPAGTSPSTRGGVWVDLGSGLSVAPNGSLSVIPATTNYLGGIKVGPGLSITPDGVLSTGGGGGTITEVIAGTGLTGGGTSGPVTLNLAPATIGTLGGIIAGSGLSVAPDGTLSISVPTGVSSVSGTSPIDISGTPSNPVVSIEAASTSQLGAVQLYDGIDSTSVSLAATANSVKLVSDETALKIPRSSFSAAGQLLVGMGPDAYSELFIGNENDALTVVGGTVVWAPQIGATALQKSGGTMTGVIVFSNGQQFPGVLEENSISASGAINITGTAANPIISVDVASTVQLGVVQPDNTTITIDGSGVISAVPRTDVLPLAGGTMTGDIVFAGTQTFPGTLPLAGGTMTGNITFDAGQTFPNTLPLSGGTLTGTVTFAAGQTFPGTVSSSLLDVTGDMVFASGANTPASLPIGAAGSILAVNGGIPAWRTSTQLGLLTSATAASTYAPLDTPTFTGPVTINSTGGAGSNALSINGGNLILASQFTPAGSSSPGSVGELAWDNSGYLYFCYLPNTWGRVQIDLTPF